MRAGSGAACASDVAAQRDAGSGLALFELGTLKLDLPLANVHARAWRPVKKLAKLPERKCREAQGDDP